MKINEHIEFIRWFMRLKHLIYICVGYISLTQFKLSSKYLPKISSTPAKIPCNDTLKCPKHPWENNV